jgi:parallel beta-helix repeat protein
VQLWKTNNTTIIGNNLTNNWRGISVSCSLNNYIIGNNIKNDNYGIWLEYSSNNIIYHNNFLNNVHHVYDRSWYHPSILPSVNVWDSGYPFGGNYWSNYTGVDYYSGPYQNISGSDGIGDTSYVIDENNTDRYPLMGPFGGLTIEGENVTAYLSSEVCLIFENVTSEGTTSVNVTSFGPEPPSGFKLAGNYYDIKTTANYSGTIRLRIVYDDSNMTLEEEMSLRLMQWNEALQEWVDITASIDIENNIVFGETTHLSMFAIFITVLAPPPLSVSISPLSSSILVGQSVTFTSTVSGGYPPYSYQWYLNGSIVSGATSNTWTFTPQTIGTYKVYLNVTDSSGNVAISDTATITVALQLTTSISPISASILVGQSITFTSITSGGYPPYTHQWFLNGNPVSGATSPSWTFTPTTSGIFYVHLKVTDAKGNTAQSEAARIAVATVPVGGYSIPIQAPAKTEQILTYIALTATLTITITKIRNKFKRRR